MNPPDTDERYGRDLMRPLAGEPDLPIHANLPRAITAGRRRRRNHRISTATAVAAVTAVILASAPTVFSALNHKPDRGNTSDTTPAPMPSGGITPSTCTPTWLPMPVSDGKENILSAGDPSGRWHAGRYRAADGDGNYVTVIWHDGQLVRTIGEFPGAQQTINDINASGTAVGRSTDDQRYQPYAYVGATTVKLPGVTSGEAMAVNDAGTIVGYRMANHSLPVRWDSATKAAINLPLPAGYDAGEAQMIDEVGTVVGEIWPRDDRLQRKPYLWHPNGAGELLPLPTIEGKPAEYFDPAGIRNGWVFGYVVAAGDKALRPYRYHTATRQFEQLTDRKVIIRAVNGSGWGVGYRESESSKAVFLVGPREVPLLSPIPDSGGANTRAVTVSDDGRSIAGDGLTHENTARPILWRCR